MDNFFLIAAMVSMLGVVVALLLGLKAMARGTEQDNRTSNRMMQLRIVFQGLAVGFLIMAFLTKG